jgi:hypothetical protein
MPQEIFYPEWDKLKQIIEAKRQQPSNQVAAAC